MIDHQRIARVLGWTRRDVDRFFENGGEACGLPGGMALYSLAVDVSESILEPKRLIYVQAFKAVKANALLYMLEKVGPLIFKVAEDSVKFQCFLRGHGYVGKLNGSYIIFTRQANQETGSKSLADRGQRHKAI